MRLLLIRHGRTDANEKHLYCGSTDIGLCDRGKEELEEARAFRKYPDISGMSVITSGKKRCEETLSVLFGAVPHESDPDFCEMNFGVFEMRSYEEMKDDPEYIGWISGDNESNIAPGGESGKLMTERVIRGISRLLVDGKDAVLITHGGVIAAVMSHLFPEEGRNRYEWQPSFGEGYAVDTAGHTWKPIPEEKENDPAV